MNTASTVSEQLLYVEIFINSNLDIANETSTSQVLPKITFYIILMNEKLLLFDWKFVHNWRVELFWL